MYVLPRELERRAYIAGLTPLAEIVDTLQRAIGVDTLQRASVVYIWVSPALLRDIDATAQPTPLELFDAV